ncbi:error-prone DNA polymerase [Luteimonas aestuarii]|uniref:Error-prone DNA polymerase n=1 Tax=Luteimonas aestuarii TaxID=453837 RepID=A0A4R5TYC1_9GAMM|nr:error-prone DNA polymerase [Luteimonas aestuarii]TDK26200.1 error-prone DNA polymerase [Luteimonas aestuarii]
MTAYAELHCLSDFSFQRGASSALELFERAKACGYAALAITDECSLAGIVRAWEAAKRTGLRLIVGTEITLADGLKLVLLAQDRDGYETICRLITTGRRAAAKGDYHLCRADLSDGLRGTLALWIPGSQIDPGQGAWLKSVMGDRVWLAVELHRDRNDARRLSALEATAAEVGLRMVAAGDVHMATRGRRALQDVLTATRHNVPVARAGAFLFRNGERHLRTMAALSATYGAALMEETIAIAERCTFTLDQLQYRYPAEIVPEGHTPASWLRQLTEEGIRWRWPGGTTAKVRAQIEHELALIRELDYEAYFLTVHDIVRFARSRNILCQGRGSAANSAVCFALGVTEVDPTRMEMLMERFISKERNEPPDIDIDFEHERREEVIQYVYRRYGRERAALAATVICYRAKSAMRDVARAMGLPGDQVDALSACVGWWSGNSPLDEKLSEAGFDPSSPVMRRVVALTGQLLDHPRHLSQHVGGFVISDAPLWSLVPVENAAMPDRTIIQWDKDDLDSLGLLKVDCLALGMLTCIRKALDLLRRHRGRDLTPASIPAEDRATYEMIGKADTIGVFQIESRAQMSFLPRMKPKCFYDLVIEVAIIRPGPIQGNMVHPFLMRRQGKEEVTYPNDAIREIYERTLGVPLFQEQVMRMAMVAAGYNAGEADQLRRSMAAWKRHGNMDHHREKIISGMLANGHPLSYAEEVFQQIVGFSGYGFPESHAASFALLTYASCWLKCHEHAAFTCALLNSQPMGFYSTSQLTQDARRKGIEIRPVDVTVSHWDNTLEDREDPREQPAIRLGLREIRGFSEAAALRLVAARERQPFRHVQDMCHRGQLDRRDQTLLAEAGALARLSGHRNGARWEIAGVEQQRPLFSDSPDEDAVDLPSPQEGEDLTADYATLGLTLGRHPLALLRDQLKRKRCVDSREVMARRSGSRVRVAGLVTLRQRPATASGTTFLTLEDEHGNVQVIVWPDLGERQRKELIGSRLMVVDGKWEWSDGVGNLVANRLHDFSEILGGLDTRSRDFH